MTAAQTFEVYLTDEASDEFGAGAIRADSVEFYDSGVWLSHADGRDFFPYRRVLRIREGAGADDTTADDTSTGERRDAASGTGSVDDTELDVG
ncbi:hypothetical protein ACFR97_07940 [Haloplanus litoreus]|uniref:Uncharacterized protein n=1 Tax=Haloplanus litoreus TaxID=767515 RepID=A0ABD5ZVJ7_9EURY